MPEPTTPDAASLRNSRYGLLLFAVYCALYAGFMGLTAFDFQLMAKPVLGVNIAVIYGFGLIIAAFALAMVYMLICKSSDEPAAEDAK